MTYIISEPNKKHSEEIFNTTQVKHYKYRGIIYTIKKCNQSFLLTYPKETGLYANMSWDDTFLNDDSNHLEHKDMTLVKRYEWLITKAKSDIDNLLDNLPDKLDNTIKDLSFKKELLEYHGMNFPKE